MLKAFVENANAIRSTDNNSLFDDRNVRAGRLQEVSQQI